MDRPIATKKLIDEKRFACLLLVLISLTLQARDDASGDIPFSVDLSQPCCWTAAIYPQF